MYIIKVIYADCGYRGELIEIAKMEINNCRHNGMVSCNSSLPPAGIEPQQQEARYINFRIICGCGYYYF